MANNVNRRAVARRTVNETQQDICKHMYQCISKILPLVALFLLINCLIAYFFNQRVSFQLFTIIISLLTVFVGIMFVYSVVTYHYLAHQPRPSIATIENVYQEYCQENGQQANSLNCPPEVTVVVKDDPPAYDSPPAYNELNFK